MPEFENLKKYSIKEVAKITSVSVRTVWIYLKTGRLQGEKLDSRWRFSQKNTEDLFETKDIRSKFYEMQCNFLKQLNKSKAKIAHSCYICYYPSKRIKNINKLREEIFKNVVNLFKIESDFFYHYNYEKNVLNLFYLEHQIK